MSTRPLITTIVTCYNKAPWIEQCIRSVLSQSIADSEVLVIDDASTDGSVEIVRRLEAENTGRLRTIFHRENKGIPATWREAVGAARGSYIARLDGDDWWISDDKLEKQIAALESSEGESKWCNTDFSIFDKDDTLVSEACFKSGTVNLPQSFEEMLSTRGFTNTSSWLADAGLLKDATAYMRDEAADDSFEMQLYMFRKTRLVTVPEPLVANRMMQGSDSRPKNTEAALERCRGLLKSQLESLERTESREVDYHKLARLLLEEQERQCETVVRLNEALSMKEVHISSLEARIEELEKELVRTRAELDSVYASKRWKLGSRLASIIGR